MNRSRIAKLRAVRVLCYHQHSYLFRCRTCAARAARVPLLNEHRLGHDRVLLADSNGLMLRERMRAAQHVLVLTGAGVSAESGVPTFRGGGNTAVWKGMPFDVISSAGMLQRDLPAVWEWFNYRRNLLAALKPNAAHTTIARWQDRFADLALVTQNIGGLHQAT